MQQQSLTYSSENMHCILVENVILVEEKHQDLFQLFGAIAYVNYSFLNRHYYVLCYLDCRDAVKALPCVRQMSVLNGLQHQTVVARFASLHEIVRRFQDNELYVRLSSTILVQYLQGKTFETLDRSIITNLHGTCGEVKNAMWLTQSVLKVTFFCITGKMRALACLTKMYEDHDLKVTIRDAGELHMTNAMVENEAPRHPPLSPSNSSGMFSPRSSTFEEDMSSTLSSLNVGTELPDTVVNSNMWRQQTAGFPRQFDTGLGYATTSRRVREIDQSLMPLSQTFFPVPPVPQLQPPGQRRMRNTHDIDFHNLRIGNDVRTTLMIRNIPNRYSHSELLELIRRYVDGQFDFLYLRIDFRVILIHLEPL
eukprot:NODE_365_length_8707_cov_1.170423.p4 type:complete len:366 gc:universal NODE_365_length_8707_cov_1.170423:7561-6464(-)